MFPPYEAAGTRLRLRPRQLAQRMAKLEQKLFSVMERNAGLSILCVAAGVLLFQDSASFHRREKLFVDRGYAAGRPVMFAVGPGFLEFHKKGEYA